MKKILDGDTPTVGSLEEGYACAVFGETITAATRRELQRRAQTALDQCKAVRSGKTHRFAVKKGGERKTDLVLEKARTEPARRSAMCYSCR